MPLGNNSIGQDVDINLNIREEKIKQKLHKSHIDFQIYRISGNKILYTS